jgi:hypothetical protein
VGEINASAVGLAIILALALALFLLRDEEETHEASGDRGKYPGNRRDRLRQ